MKILFLHGRHSVPNGLKPECLRRNGHDVISPKLDDDDFESAVGTAQREFDSHQPQVIAGSSRGSAIAMNIRSAQVPLVLLCPAWKRWGTAATLKPASLVLHSRQDDVIPFADSEELIAKSGLSPDRLIEVGQDHRLADPESLKALLWACEIIASGEQGPWLEEDAEMTAADVMNRHAESQEEAVYVCDACGEEIVIPVDLSEGSTQTYVEDCPVCCCANTIHVQVDSNGKVQVWADPEQDRNQIVD